MNLASMVVAAREQDSPLERLRRGLSEEDRAVFDTALEVLRGYKQSTLIGCAPTPMEALLLLLIQKQHQRIESLEFLFQQSARRQLELWAQTAVNEPNGTRLRQTAMVLVSSEKR